MSALFRAGARVRVRSETIPGHCRTPSYLRGKSGVVIEVHGEFRNPEKLAYHKPGLPRQPLYMVRFRQADLWPGYAGPASDILEADIYEHWLEPDDTGVSHGDAR